jgi:hypothetical protein
MSNPYNPGWPSAVFFSASAENVFNSAVVIGDTLADATGKIIPDDEFTAALVASGKL